MKTSNIRWVFVIVVFVFFLELLLSLKGAEPFPAIIYPPFADIPSHNSVIHKPRIVIFFPGGDSLEIDKEAFFHDMTNVYNNVILSRNFNQVNSFQLPIKEGKTLGVTIGTRKISVELEGVLHKTQIQEGKIWIAHRLKQILKRDDFTRMEVQWYNYTLSPKEEEPLKQGALSERFVVSFID